MIVRIVKMTFQQDKIAQFQQLFTEKKELIRHFTGCAHLELWQDAHESNIFFTYSKWEDEHALNHYRFSPLFKEVWSNTKPLFLEKAEAWSVNPLINVL